VAYEFLIASAFRGESICDVGFAVGSCLSGFRITDAPALRRLRGGKRTLTGIRDTVTMGWAKATTAVGIRVGSLALAMATVASCNKKSYVSSECWSTRFLRVSIGDLILDLPAALQPIPDPTPKEGYRPIDYTDGKLAGLHRLWNCQDRPHVPLRVRAIYFRARYSANVRIIRYTVKLDRLDNYSRDLRWASNIIDLDELPRLRMSSKPVYLGEHDIGPAERRFGLSSKSIEFVHRHHKTYFNCDTTHTRLNLDTGHLCEARFRITQQTLMSIQFFNGGIGEEDYPKFAASVVRPLLR